MSIHYMLVEEYGVIIVQSKIFVVTIEVNQHFIQLVDS